MTVMIVVVAMGPRGDYGGVGEAVLDLKYVKETIWELVVVVVVVTMMVMVTEKVADMDM